MLCAVGWLACRPASAQAPLDRAFFLQISASLFKVEAGNGNGSFSLGTAVAVAPGTVVTNCHVTRDAQAISLVKGAARWRVASQLPDLKHDLCLLDVPGLDATPVEMRSANELKVGQRVGALGFTGGVEMTLRDGVVRTLHRFDGSNVIQSSTAFTSGASGGGLFDEHGRLVGILTFRLRGANAYYFSAPVDWIEASARKPEAYVGIAPLDGVPFWQQPIDHLPYFMRAAALEADGQWQELVKLAEEWSDVDADNPEPWLSRGRAYAWLGRREGAARAFEKAVALQPESGEAWFNLGLTYFRLGDSDALQRVLVKLAELDHELADDLAVVSGSARN